MTSWVERLDTPRQQAVGRELENYLRQGLGHGATLPGERELASRFQVSRPTLRRVLGEMERNGLIRTVKSLGRQATLRPASALTDTVAVLTDLQAPLDLDDRRSQGWEIYVQGGVLRTLAGRGWHSLVLNVDRVDENRLESLVEQGLRGAVVARSSLQPQAVRKILRPLSDAGLPAVIYGASEDFEGFDTVYSDQASGSAMLTRWLIDRGHRRILRLWHWSDASNLPAWQRQRSAGHEEAMRAAGLDPLPVRYLPLTESPDLSPLGREMAVRTTAGYLMEILRETGPVDALMAISDGPAVLLTAALKLMRIDLPVVGYDNYFAVDPFRPTAAPDPVATVDKRHMDIGVALAELALERVEAKLPLGAQHRLVPPRLVVSEHMSSP